MHLFLQFDTSSLLCYNRVQEAVSKKSCMLVSWYSLLPLIWLRQLQNCCDLHKSDGIWKEELDDSLVPITLARWYPLLLAISCQRILNLFLDYQLSLWLPKPCSLLQVILFCNYVFFSSSLVCQCPLMIIGVDIFFWCQVHCGQTESHMRRRQVITDAVSLIPN